MTESFENVKKGCKCDNIDENDSIIIYKICDNKIRIFGQTFINNNLNKIRLEINGEDYELMEYYEVKNKNDKKLLEVKIKGIENFTDMSYMFYGCSSLLNLPDISKWNISKVTDMRYMFGGCSSLLNLPDISKWNTSKVTNMECIFYECSSLPNLPDFLNGIHLILLI